MTVPSNLRYSTIKATRMTVRYVSSPSPTQLSPPPRPPPTFAFGGLVAMSKLMCDLFFHFFNQDVLNTIVLATNAKAHELVVKEKTSFRTAEATDPQDDLFNCTAGLHARHRAPDLVRNPLTVHELVCFLGIRIVMGGYWSARLEDYWSSTDTHDRCDVIADTMKLDRFKLILATLTFLRPGYAGNPTFGGTADRLFKIREVNDLLLLACQGAWDIEPDFVVDESRLRLSSRYCSFTTQMCARDHREPYTYTYITLPL